MYIVSIMDLIMIIILSWKSFNCLGGIDRNGEKIIKNISYILQFLDSARFMASLLSNLVNIYSEGIHKIKC